MSREIHGPSLVRCLWVWSLVTVVAAALPLALAPELGGARRLSADGLAGMPFDRLLTTGCAIAVSACAVWFWAVATLTLALALRGHRGRVPGCPDGVRRLVLAACGLAVVAVAAPSVADEPAGSPPTPDPTSVLAGLPYPDRATLGPGPAVPSRAVPSRDVPWAPDTATVRVRPGDTLWAIARRRLTDDAAPAAIDLEWRAIWHANRSTIGPDPDLLLPGSSLRLPTTKES